MTRAVGMKITDQAEHYSGYRMEEIDQIWGLLATEGEGGLGLRLESWREGGRDEITLGVVSWRLRQASPGRQCTNQLRATVQ